MKTLAYWSPLAIVAGAALGWRLEGMVLAIIGGILGYAFCVWANDWEVRRIVKRSLDEREARRLGA